MGYTHYWTFKTPKRGTARVVAKQYKTAILACQKIVHIYNLGRVDDTRLAGYTAHVKPGTYNGLGFNGTADLSHEDFTARDYYMPGFNFCKTAQKPYDLVVVACLVTLKHYLGDNIEVSSDGDIQDFIAGTVLARKILGIRGLKNPLDAVSMERRLALV